MDVRSHSCIFVSSLSSFSCALVVALFHLIKNHRNNVKFLTPYLKSRDSALSGRQYYRLMAMCIILGLWGTVWFSLEIQVTSMQGSYPIPSWKVIHEGDSEIIKLPTILLGPETIHDAYILWWGVPGGALLIFLLFGTSYEVLSEYVKFWTWFRTRVLKQLLREKAVTVATIHLGYVLLFFPLSLQEHT
jgi:hypothetical protein